MLLLIINGYFSILQLFMLPNFSLENPDTFNAVFPWTQVEESRTSVHSESHPSSKLLQERVCKQTNI